MSGEKTEQPTERKLEDKRKEGQLPQRKNVLETVLLTTSVLLLAAMASSISGSLLTLMDVTLGAVRGDFQSGLQFGFAAVENHLLLLLAFCGGVFLVTFLCGLFLNRFNFAPKAMTPKFEKLNPVGTLKSLFSMSTLYNFVRLVVYFCVLSALLTVVVYTRIDDVLKASECGLACLSPLFIRLLMTVVAVILLVLIVLAAVDYGIQTRLFRSQNKMSKTELKNEFKNQEGDPMIKGARRSLAVNSLHEPGLKDATHVIYGENLLVAIIYYPDSGVRPFMVMKARGSAAIRLRRKSASFGIKTINLPVVATDFHRMAPVGQYLPARSALGIARMMTALEGAPSHERTL